MTERDFQHEGQNGFLGSGTSGTVFKKKFKTRDVAVKQIAKSDDKDEMKVFLIIYRGFDKRLVFLYSV